MTGEGRTQAGRERQRRERGGGWRKGEKVCRCVWGGLAYQLSLAPGDRVPTLAPVSSYLPQPFPHREHQTFQGAQEEGALFQFPQGRPTAQPLELSSPGSQPTSSHFLLHGPGW